MSVAAKAYNWCSFDPTAQLIDVTTDPTPPAAAALVAAANAVVQAVAVTPYVGTGHLCYRHGYTAGGSATSATQLYFTMSIAPGAVHAKLTSTDRMSDAATVTPAQHVVWTATGGSGANDIILLPMVPPFGAGSGNQPSFWAGAQHLAETSNAIVDTPTAAQNRMLELPSFRHPVKESGYVSAVMAWSCRVAHITQDLASL